MFESPHKLQRLASDKVRELHHEADLARSLAAVHLRRHSWRWRLGETLLRLAGRLSPQHRTLLAPLRECLPDGTPTEHGAAA